MIDNANTDKECARLIQSLEDFHCDKDYDIENFLHSKALEFEKRGLCSVYLLLDEYMLTTGKLKVVAYFTLSHRALVYMPTVSRNTKGRISSNRDSHTAHFVLIGQLGKFMLEDESAEITAKDILKDAFSIVRKSSRLIPCKFVLVECSSEEKVHQVYKDNGFSYLQFDDKHYQFFKKL